MYDTAVSDSLKKLKELTEEVPSFESFRRIDTEEGAAVYEGAEGKGISFGLLSIPEISVARTLFSKGTVFDWHCHEQAEWLIVYKGQMLITIGKDGREEIADSGDWAYISSMIPHAARFPEDTWLLAITIPKSEGWPNA